MAKHDFDGQTDAAGGRVSPRGNSTVAWRLHAGPGRRAVEVSVTPPVKPRARPAVRPAPLGHTLPKPVGALGECDARWELAKLAAFEIAGARPGSGSAEREPGGLSAASRKRLLERADQLGLRPFDANLVLAIMQDSARQGEEPLSPSVQARLLMVGPAQASGQRLEGADSQARRERARVVLIASWSVALAAVMVYGAIRWLLGH